MHRTWFKIQGLLAVMALGCGAPGNKSHLSKVAAPPTYSTSTASPSPAVDADGWLKDFSDERLPELVAEAQRNNFDLMISATRLMAARGTARMDSSGMLPTVGAGLSGARNKRVSTAGFRLTNPKTDTFDVGLDFAWELDLWGRLANRSRAAYADVEAAQSDFVAAQFSLAANTSKAWFRLVEAAMQYRLAREAFENFGRNLVVVEERFQRGVTTALDVRLTRASLSSAESTLKLRERERGEAARALEVLLGRYPTGGLEVPETLPLITRPIPGGLPAELLQRRPDLVSAERRLAASDERFQDANKNRFPSLRLTASGGTSSAALEDLLDPNQNVWRLASGIVQPLLQGGRLRGERLRADARLQEQIAIYSRTVLGAFQEVENALANELLLREQETALRSASEESRAAEEIAWEQYGRGLADIITVLESQRRHVTAAASLYTVSRVRLQNRVDLHLALGGDFAPAVAVHESETNE
jgi:multidrug efflux system outer membrane protein